MAVEIRKRYQLGEYWLEPDAQLLSRDGQALHLTSLPFQILLYLVEHRERLVGRAELLDRFWSGRDVYDESLSKAVSAIRKALADPSDQPRFIETRRASGYRYIGPLEEELLGNGSVVAEIERTREVKVIIEEEMLASALAGAPVVALPSLAEPQSLAKRYVTRRTVNLAVVCGLIALAGIALVSFFRRADNEKGQAAPLRSIAVLPLKNLTGDPAQEYFSDGMTESLITALSKSAGLKVISRSSVFTFKGKEVDPREVGRQLGVGSVLEGSVRKNGDSVRVAIRLVSAADGQVLWVSDTYNRALQDIFAIQDEIGCSVAASLSALLCGAGKNQFAKRYTDSVAAYQAYLKARYFWDNQKTAAGLKKALEYFQQAIDQDPRYALAYAGLARCHQTSIWFAVQVPPQAAMAKVKAAAARALELDDSLAEAHLALANVYWNDWDFVNGLREGQRALELDPGAAETHHGYAYSLILLDRPAEAIAEIKRAQELDPLSVTINVDVGEILLYARRYAEAGAALRQALEMDPNRANAHWDLALAYEQAGRFDQAVATRLKYAALSGESQETVAALQAAFAAAGMSGFWQKQLDLRQEKAKRSYIPPLEMAGLYARLGEKDQAFAWLERAYAEHSPHLYSLKLDVMLDSLRSDARFAALLRRVGLD